MGRKKFGAPIKSFCKNDYWCRIAGIRYHFLRVGGTWVPIRFHAICVQLQPHLRCTCNAFVKTGLTKNATSIRYEMCERGWVLCRIIHALMTLVECTTLVAFNGIEIKTDTRYTSNQNDMRIPIQETLWREWWLKNFQKTDRASEIRKIV